MWLRVLLVGGLLAGLLGACAVIDPVDSRYDTISRSLAKARNDAIFLNLIRAAHDYPLSFTTIANVTPSLTNTTTLGMPNFLFGPRIGGTATAPLFTPGRDIIFNNTTASNATAISTNFNVATQETSAFYEGFLKPIDLTTLDYFIRQGYPPELLFWLFADSVEISARGHTMGYRYDPPNDYGCPVGEPKQRCFIDFVHIATATGLTVEEKTVQKSGGGAAKGGGEGGGSSKPSTTVYPRFCFNSVLAQRAIAAMGSNYRSIKAKDFDVPPSAFLPRCGQPWNPLENADQPQPDTFALNVGPITFKITPRSAYGVFEFLGTILKMQRQQIVPPADVNIPGGRDDVVAAPTLWTVREDVELITVVPPDNNVKCFAHTWFEDGTYCVPESATTTKRIFSLLAQLIAIQTAASDLSITPVVRVIQ